jgi:Ca2+-binding EF-hand superfamily protein
LARLNSEGITAVEIKGPGLSSGVQPSSPGAGGDGILSEASFEAIAENFGATKTQADQDFDHIDANGNGAVSNAELLSALSSTRDTSSPSAQALLSLMDVNGDRGVSGTEFLNFETAAVSAEELPTTGA